MRRSTKRISGAAAALAVAAALALCGPAAYAAPAAPGGRDRQRGGGTGNSFRGASHGKSP